jgi:hypothetical protein
VNGVPDPLRRPSPIQIRHGRFHGTKQPRGAGLARGQPCPASRRRRLHRQRRGSACSAPSLLCARLRRAGACITRCGGVEGEKPGAAGCSWRCCGAPQLASPGRPGTAAFPGCFTLIRCRNPPFFSYKMVRETGLLLSFELSFGGSGGDSTT